MTISDKQKQWIVWGVLVVLIAVMGFLGINFPVPVPPTPEGARVPLATLSPDTFVRVGSIEAIQLRVKNNEEHVGLETHSGIEAHSGTETHSGAATFSGATTVSNLTATTITATTLISQSIGFNATGASDFVSTTVTGPLTVTGATILNGGLAMDTNKFTVADTSGNTAISGTLLAAGAVTANGGVILPAGGITQGGLVFTSTTPITISGVLTNVRLLYYQVP